MDVRGDYWELFWIVWCSLMFFGCILIHGEQMKRYISPWKVEKILPPCLQEIPARFTIFRTGFALIWDHLSSYLVLGWWDLSLWHIVTIIVHNQYLNFTSGYEDYMRIKCRLNQIHPVNFSSHHRDAVNYNLPNWFTFTVPCEEPIIRMLLFPLNGKPFSIQGGAPVR